MNDNNTLSKEQLLMLSMDYIFTASPRSLSGFIEHLSKIGAFVQFVGERGNYVFFEIVEEDRVDLLRHRICKYFNISDSALMLLKHDSDKKEVFFMYSPNYIDIGNNVGFANISNILASKPKYQTSK